MTIFCFVFCSLSLSPSLSLSCSLAHTHTLFSRHRTVRFASNANTRSRSLSLCCYCPLVLALLSDFYLVFILYNFCSATSWTEAELSWTVFSRLVTIFGFMCMVKLMTWSNLFYCVRTMRLYVIRYSFYFMYIFSLLDWMMLAIVCVPWICFWMALDICVFWFDFTHSLLHAMFLSFSMRFHVFSSEFEWTTHNRFFCIAMKASPIPRTIYSYLYMIRICRCYFFFLPSMYAHFYGWWCVPCATPFKAHFQWCNDWLAWSFILESISN